MPETHYQISAVSPEQSKVQSIADTYLYEHGGVVRVPSTNEWSVIGWTQTQPDVLFNNYPQVDITIESTEQRNAVGKGNDLMLAGLTAAGVAGYYIYTRE